MNITSLSTMSTYFKNKISRSVYYKIWAIAIRPEYTDALEKKKERFFDLQTLCLNDALWFSHHKL